MSKEHDMSWLAEFIKWRMMNRKAGLCTHPLGKKFSRHRGLFNNHVKKPMLGYEVFLNFTLSTEYQQLNIFTEDEKIKANYKELNIYYEKYDCTPPSAPRTPLSTFWRHEKEKSTNFHK